MRALSRICRKMIESQIHKKPMATPVAPGHIGVLDGVRALSILLVIAGHLLPLGPSEWGVNYSAAVGGMSLFFILSGFLICSFLLNDPPIGEFLVKRVTRIVPAVTLYLFVVFVVIDFAPMRALVTGVYLSNYLTDYGGHLNGHLWSLAVEMHFYVFAAVLAALFGRRGLIVFTGAMLAVTALRIATGTGVSIKSHFRVDEILAGASLALFYYGRFGAHAKIKKALGAGLPFFIIFWAATLRPDWELLFYLRPYAAMLLVGSILFCRLSLVRATLESSPMRYIATISYALYIWHFFVVSYGMNEGSDMVRYLVKRPISIALLLVIAHASTFYWEQPISRYIRRRFTKPHIAPAN